MTTRIRAVDQLVVIDTNEPYMDNGVLKTRALTGRTDGRFRLTTSRERNATTGALPTALLDVAVTESGTNTGVYSVKLEGETLIPALGALPAGRELYRWGYFGVNGCDGLFVEKVYWAGL